MANSLLTRLGLALAGQALPDEAALQHAGQDLRSAILFSMVSGISFGALLLFGGYQFYTYLMTQGVTMVAASLIVGGFLLLLTIIAYQFAASRFNAAASRRKSVGLFPEKKNDQLLEQMIAAFLEGLCHKEPEGSTPTQESETEDVQKIILVKE